MSDPKDRRLIEFDRLNLLGKAVFVTGAAIRTTAGLVDLALDRAADLAVEVEHAFRQGRDPNVEDAKILDEWPEKKRG